MGSHSSWILNRGTSSTLGANKNAIKLKQKKNSEKSKEEDDYDYVDPDDLRVKEDKEEKKQETTIIYVRPCWIKFILPVFAISLTSAALVGYLLAWKTYHGGLWDQEDSCCENKCSPERMCTSGQGLCESVADCLTVPGDIDSVCVQCTDTSMFPPTKYPQMLSYNYSVEDKCCLSRGIQHIKIFDCGVEWLGVTYGFRGNMFWKITEDNGFTPQYPKLISSTWIGLPSSGIDASYTKNDVTYFFKGSQLYAFSQTYTLMAGYPINISDRFHGLVDNIDAAANIDHKLYIFKGNQYWRYDYENTVSGAGYPAPIAGYWIGVNVASVDALIRVGGDFIFFTPGLVYKFNIATDRVYDLYPQDVANSWLKTV